MKIRIKFNSGDSSDRIQGTNQMTPLQQFFHMVLFIQYVILTFKSVHEILWCDHSNKTSSAVLSHGTIYLVRSSNF